MCCYFVFVFLSFNFIIDKYFVLTPVTRYDTQHTRSTYAKTKREQFKKKFWNVYNARRHVQHFVYFRAFELFFFRFILLLLIKMGTAHTTIETVTILFFYFYFLFRQCSVSACFPWSIVFVSRKLRTSFFCAFTWTQSQLVINWTEETKMN